MLRVAGPHRGRIAGRIGCIRERASDRARAGDQNESWGQQRTALDRHRRGSRREAACSSAETGSAPAPAPAASDASPSGTGEDDGGASPAADGSADASSEAGLPGSGGSGGFTCSGEASPRTYAWDTGDAALRARNPLRFTYGDQDFLRGDIESAVAPLEAKKFSVTQKVIPGAGRCEFYAHGEAIGIWTAN